MHQGNASLKLGEEKHLADARCGEGFVSELGLRLSVEFDVLRIESGAIVLQLPVQGLIGLSLDDGNNEIGIPGPGVFLIVG